MAQPARTEPAPPISRPTGLAILPDGRVLVVEKDTGHVKVVTPSAVALVGTVPNVSTQSQRGLLGVAIDDQWPAWPYIYVHYTHVSGFVYRETAFEGAKPVFNEFLNLCAFRKVIVEYIIKSPE